MEILLHGPSNMFMYSVTSFPRARLYLMQLFTHKMPVTCTCADNFYKNPSETKKYRS